ncbi:PREDICTED: phosphoribosylformylglycinamidine cyclo-ligase, chloroplastic-like [Populus euphratica]|uniref:phosphoribosylformylglycinamidine cyclo-ligase n=1 Tax=Populus euphratica TaxID=75702 RepID=A0AAJ6Y557_POPEU|nr:PREDICTED: phosphoribosylformylglycinamidine cyclo-ligase, chloroplastic-like [Populus euphratica]
MACYLIEVDNYGNSLSISLNGPLMGAMGNRPTQCMMWSNLLTLKVAVVSYSSLSTLDHHFTKTDNSLLTLMVLLNSFQTAEMPDFYAEGEYDLSGFAVGIVRKDSVIHGENIVAGDVLIGLPSSGVHSNGFSLQAGFLSSFDLISKGGVKGIVHITGGGFTDNIPRVFPKDLGASIYKESWEAPALFKWIQEAGRIEDAEMSRTFNMGIGMVTEEASLKVLEEGQHKPYRIGEVVCGEGVRYC